MQAGIMDSPRPSPSMAYSGQCLAKICVEAAGAVLAETSMTVLRALTIPNDPNDRRRWALRRTRHSDLNPGPGWTRHKPCTYRIQIQRFRIFPAGPGKLGYPKPS